LSPLLLCGQSKTYFISPDGNDSASGLSIQAAWKSIDKVNQTTFQPGDQILFKAGATWYGQLQPKGSGEKDKPIILSSYGGNGKPIINIGKAEGAGIRLFNQSWWEICNMEITSGAPAELGVGRQGIAIIVKGNDEHAEHFVVRNCYVHDIYGQMGGNGEFVGYNSCAILVRTMFDRNRDRSIPSTTTIDDVLIENNRIERFDKCGIIIWGAKHNVLVRKNYIDNLGGDGIFVNGTYRGLIEYNEVRRTCMRSGYLDLPGGEEWWPHTAAIWIQRAEETIMQFNEVYDTGREPKNGDGFAYDFDFDCKRCIAQFNYSKNNYGLMLVMNRTFENITRYNISENDKTHLVQIHCDLSDRNVFYNNVFYVDYGTADLDFYRGGDKNANIDKLGSLFYNNIFYATGQGRFRTVYTAGDVIGRDFDETSKPNLPAGSLFLNNCYYGPWKNGLPNDPKKLEADPLFVSPGQQMQRGQQGAAPKLPQQGAVSSFPYEQGYNASEYVQIGTASKFLCGLEGYMLRPGSPCINAGLFVPANCNRDFFDNPVNDGSVDIGAFEMLGTGVFADTQKEKAMNDEWLIESRVAWTKWMFPKTLPIPEDGKLTIKLREPIATTVSGSLTWIDNKGNSKPVTVQIDKAKQRDTYTFVLKADKETLLQSSVRVSIKEGNFSEEWDIPLAIPTPGRR